MHRRSRKKKKPVRSRLELLEARQLLAGNVVINEIHYDPDVKTEAAEFIELYNAGDEEVNLSNWLLTDGVDYHFAAGTSLPAGAYLVIAQDPATVQSKFGVAALGPYVGKLSNEGDDVVLRNAAGEVQDRVDYQLGFPWPTVGDPPGPSIELINPALDNDLGGSWRPATSRSGPTPGAMNSVFADNAAPQMRQVEHSPREPRSGEVVTVTAKATDPDGVASLMLEYQLVDPGNYISRSDRAFATAWTALAMVDDGTAGDARAGDGVYTVQIPADLQTHRRLVRYRITAEDVLGESIRGPYADDPQPNFAYYVYDGAPDWTGAVQPGAGGARGEPNTFGSEVMNSLPVYQLITKRSEHVDAQFIPNAARGSGYTGSDYLWRGTLVYDGVVYDHIRYRARGGVWRYAMGKNMWKFDFNRGHGFQARDDYGEKYSTTWDKLNFSAVIQQGNFNHRGEQGLFESVGFKLFDLAGVESPATNFAQFRIVEDASETGADQYSGDFQGLYLAIEQLDGNFLDQHDLPDGNLYKMEGGTGDANNIGPAGPTNKSDLNTFLNTYRGPTQTEAWWRDNLDLERYYSYRAIVEGIHHYDIGAGKNYFYYRNPDTGQWSVHPWDLDLTWDNGMFGDGAEPFRNLVSTRAEFSTEYKNRMREIRDLLYNEEQTGQLIDEMASFIYNGPGSLSMVDADRAMWDYNPILTSSYVNSSKAGHNRFYQAGATNDFAGMIERMKDYVDSRSAFIDSTIAFDPRIPNTPVATSTAPANFSINNLTFQSSAFDQPRGVFGAMKWRIAEVTDPANPNYDPHEPVRYEINSAWESDEITTFDANVTIPGAALEVGRTYRVRVRMQSSGGGWSHWSEPVQFIAGPASSELADSLRITELMYHPLDGDDDLEFIELVNIANEPIDVSGVRIVNGVAFTMPTNTMIAAGERVLLTRFDPAADDPLSTAKQQRFADVYRVDSAVRQFGPYDGKLDDGGETVHLVDALGATIVEFTYNDSGAWPNRADGGGSSLEVVDPSAGQSAGDPPSSVVLAVNTTTGEAFIQNFSGVGVDIDGYTVGSASGALRPGDGDWLSFQDQGIGSWTESNPTTNNLSELRPSGGTLLADGSVHAIGRPFHAAAGARDLTFSLSVFEDDVIVGSVVYFSGTGPFQPSQGLNAPGSWRASTEFGGSPGGAGMGAFADVVVNEVLSRPLVDGGDVIELFNTSSEPVEVSGWFLSDSNNNYFKFTMPTQTIPGGGYLLLDESDFNPTPGLGTSFALDGLGGDDVWLVAADAAGRPVRFADRAEFGGSAAGESFGRWPNGAGGLFPMTSVTLGAANSGPRIGPVVISELHYNPTGDAAGDDLEFIELHNRTSSEIDLEGWRLDGVNYLLPAGALIPGGGVLVVTPFDPNDAQKADAFRAHYNLDAGVRLVGGYPGRLDNGGERLQLLRPDAVPAGSSEAPLVLMDQVDYNNMAPWPIEADGGGDSLHRQAADAFGDFAASWRAGAPTPGAAAFTPRVPGDANGDGRVDLVDLNAVRNNFGGSGLGDVNDDGVVDLVDLNAVRNNFGAMAATPAAPTPTPQAAPTPVAASGLNNAAITSSSVVTAADQVNKPAARVLRGLATVINIAPDAAPLARSAAKSIDAEVFSSMSPAQRSTVHAAPTEPGERTIVRSARRAIVNAQRLRAAAVDQVFTAPARDAPSSAHPLTFRSTRGHQPPADATTPADPWDEALAGFGF